MDKTFALNFSKKFRTMDSYEENNNIPISQREKTFLAERCLKIKTLVQAIFSFLFSLSDNKQGKNSSSIFSQSSFIPKGGTVRPLADSGDGFFETKDDGDFSLFEPQNKKKQKPAPPDWVFQYSS